MRILWVCNIMLPVAAQHLQREVSNREGWLTGMSSAILEQGDENGITLGVAFPVEKDLEDYREVLEEKGRKLYCYGFCEDLSCPEVYKPYLEDRLHRIIQDFQPEVIHCFGTEFPHTLAVSRVAPREKVLISIQGLCAVCAGAYRANLPDKVWHRATFRDRIRKDSLIEQQEKFVKRGRLEIEALKNVGNVAGRTDWDRHYTKEWNKEARYFTLNETLRPVFYGEKWKEENCKPYSIFVSQGDYPIKGLHYMLLAMPLIQKRFPQVRLYVAGNSLVENKTLKQRIKRSAYGSYLAHIMKENKLEDKVIFLGKLSAEQMKQQYLKSAMFVCCSSMENSPNSLGEAMLLGMPCVTADVGGIPSLFRDREDGILYKGFHSEENTFDNACNETPVKEGKLEMIVKALADGVVEMWEKPELKVEFTKNARLHAKNTHDSDKNYKIMTDIYSQIAGEKCEKNF